MIKKKCVSSMGALMTVTFSTMDCQIACDRWLSIMDLNFTIASFMSHDTTKKKHQFVEHSLSILFNLIQHLEAGPRRNRLFSKFAEGKFEKCGRLVNLFFKFRYCNFKCDEVISAQHK